MLGNGIPSIPIQDHICPHPPALSLPEAFLSPPAASRTLRDGFPYHFQYIREIPARQITQAFPLFFLCADKVLSVENQGSSLSCTLSFPRKEALVLSSSSVGADGGSGGKGREPADPRVSRNSRASGLGVADAIQGFKQHHPLTFPPGNTWSRSTAPASLEAWWEILGPQLWD